MRSKVKRAPRRARTPIVVPAAARRIASLIASPLSILQRLAAAATLARRVTRPIPKTRSVPRKARDATIPSTNRMTEMTFLAGYKTYIVAAAMAVFAIAGLLGVDIPSFEGHAPGSLLMEALAIIFLRQGIKTDLGSR